LFLGPSGVGKTELCRALSEALFGSEEAMLRLDMSEYMEAHTVSRLLGAPPGYVGYDEGGQLTRRVRERPYSLVLFDELEKAHGEIFNILLQILEDGILTDSQGRRVDFRNTLIVMTSNVGAARLNSGARLGFVPTEEDGTRADRSVAEAELKKTFRPELLGRIDEVIVFRRLGEPERLEIARRLLAALGERLRQRGLALEVSDEALALLAEEGRSNAGGARTLRRVIRTQVEDALARLLLEEPVPAGGAIVVEAPEGKITLAKKQDGVK
ncbi:MAG TPA: AAA family ATPase, partial [Oscillospiraceae bacterium]|nr:AAA family ATPase [Oscillospiraceae bacterium]